MADFEHHIADKPGTDRSSTATSSSVPDRDGAPVLTAALGLPLEFDGYRLVGMLGRGAMGVVFAAEDRLLARHVAIKVLLARHAHESGQSRFEREARILARLSHPNVLSIHRAGEVAGARYIVSELIRGQTLQALKTPIPQADVLRLAAGIAAGLAAAHRKGVLHRDLKPSNVMLSDDGEIKICDFGIAQLTHGEEDPPSVRSVGSRAADVTSTGGWVGTPRYLAPEIWGGGVASVHSDLFAFGALLFKLFTGRDALPGDDLDAIKQVALGPGPQRIAGSHVAPNSRLAILIDRCLESDPARRPASAEEVHAELVGIASPQRAPCQAPLRTVPLAPLKLSPPLLFS
jgi:eukaryotic-like serine/threonine-protein kinase